MKETRSANKVLVGKPEAKRPLGRCRRRWEDNVKFDLKTDLMEECGVYESVL
jgi:hypothetical protein